MVLNNYQSILSTAHFARGCAGDAPVQGGDAFQQSGDSLGAASAQSVRNCLLICWNVSPTCWYVSRYIPGTYLRTSGTDWVHLLKKKHVSSFLNARGRPRAFKIK